MKLIQLTTIKAAKQEFGGLSNTSKMPGYSWNLPALTSCPVGDKLAKIPGSVCHGCYATKGRYLFGNVQKSMTTHLEGIYREDWVDIMTFMINKQCVGKKRYFRWHDSGDLISMDYFKKIIQVCNNTPNVSHWLPTREYSLIRRYKKDGGEVPSNLCIRLSAHMIDGPGPKMRDMTISTVSTGDKPEGSVRCKAYTREGKCASCRACWNSKVQHIDYKKH